MTLTYTALVRASLRRIREEGLREVAAAAITAGGPTCLVFPCVLALCLHDLNQKHSCLGHSQAKEKLGTPDLLWNDFGMTFSCFRDVSKQIHSFMNIDL